MGLFAYKRHTPLVIYNLNTIKLICKNWWVCINAFEAVKTSVIFSFLYMLSALGICFVHTSLWLPSDSENPGALSSWPDSSYFRGASPAHRATCAGSGLASGGAAHPSGLHHVLVDPVLVYFVNMVPKVNVSFGHVFIAVWFVFCNCGLWVEPGTLVVKRWCLELLWTLSHYENCLISLGLSLIIIRVGCFFQALILFSHCACFGHKSIFYLYYRKVQ